MKLVRFPIFFGGSNQRRGAVRSSSDPMNQTVRMDQDSTSEVWTRSPGASHQRWLALLFAKVFCEEQPRTRITEASQLDPDVAAGRDSLGSPGSLLKSLRTVKSLDHGRRYLSPSSLKTEVSSAASRPSASPRASPSVVSRSMRKTSSPQRTPRVVAGSRSLPVDSEGAKEVKVSMDTRHSTGQEHQTSVWDGKFARCSVSSPLQSVLAWPRGDERLTGDRCTT